MTQRGDLLRRRHGEEQFVTANRLGHHAHLASLRREKPGACDQQKDDETEVRHGAGRLRRIG
jgi:hypothetical protein